MVLPSHNLIIKTSAAVFVGLPVLALKNYGLDIGQLVIKSSNLVVSF
jgi:hypothetical protein